MNAPVQLRVVVALSIALVSSMAAADFNVTSPGSFFAISSNGTALGNNPTLTLVRGRTYTFAVTTSSFHPFQILALGTAVNNNINSGTVTFTVATNAPATTTPGYRCSVHGFSGTILAVDPPIPPVPRIVSFSFSSNIVLRTSPATNTFTVVPEFRTNLNFTNWLPLSVQSNRFLNGTNETFCGRPPGSNVFIRVRVQ
jgi:hypothetical protein